MNIYSERIAALRRVMAENGIDYYMVPTADFHQSEYVADYFKVREFLSGFTGSNGTLVVSQDFAGLWTDGRYFIQAEHELEGSGIALMRMADKGVPTIEEFLLEKMPENSVLGFDGRCVPAEEGLRLEAGLAAKNVTIRADRDLADEVWTGRPKLPCAKVFLLDEVKYAGESVEEKLSRLREKMAEQGASYYATGRLDEIMWLYNIRGGDVECNPVALSYAFVSEKRQYLFLQEQEVTGELRDYAAKKSIILMHYGAFAQFLQDRDYSGNVLYDPEGLSYLLYRAAEAKLTQQQSVAGAAVSNDRRHVIRGGRLKMIGAPSPIGLMKAVKNETEIVNIRSCYIEDSAALCRFIYRITKRAGKAAAGTALQDEKGKVTTEYSAAMELDALRAEISDYVELSFPTIAGYGENAAMMHYEATENQTAELKAEGMFLVDSGGQYLRGTTDVTRTFALGPVTDDMKKHFTLTAVGNLQLQDAVFLYGCTGKNVDILSREPLWQIGIDYKCGTGHGIGYLLNVHEGPQNIRWRFAPGQKEAVLEPGMIVSDEPGVYLEGRYGIRIETILLVREKEENGDGRFLCFEPLTFVPIDRALIDPEYLTPRTREVLNDYHRQTYEKIAPFLNDEERAWLKEQTAPI